MTRGLNERRRARWRMGARGHETTEAVFLARCPECSDNRTESRAIRWSKPNRRCSSHETSHPRSNVQSTSRPSSRRRATTVPIGRTSGFSNPATPNARSEPTSVARPRTTASALHNRPVRWGGAPEFSAPPGPSSSAAPRPPAERNRGERRPLLGRSFDFGGDRNTPRRRRHCFKRATDRSLTFQSCMFSI